MATNNLQLEFLPTGEGFQIIDILIGGNGVIDHDDLKTLNLPVLPSGEGLVIHGKAPIFLYAHLALNYHPANWIAIYMPQNSPIVVASRSPKYKVGETLDKQIILRHITHREGEKKPKGFQLEPEYKAIALMGPPHSGKSVLLNAMRIRLRQSLLSEIFHREVFILRACPDGEGDFFHDSPLDEVMTLRYKYQFDDEFVDKMCKQLRSLMEEKRLILVDCGGRIDKRNQRIWNLCTNAIITSSDPAKIPEWRGAATASNLTMLAEIETVMEEALEVISDNVPLRVRLGKLERGSPPGQLPDILIHRIISGLYE